MSEKTIFMIILGVLALIFVLFQKSMQRIFGDVVITGIVLAIIYWIGRVASTYPIPAVAVAVLAILLVRIYVKEMRR